MPHEVRALTQEEIPALLEAMALGFAQDQNENEAAFTETAEMERTRCVFDGDTLVGTCGAYSLELSVPGGSLRAGGTTWVTVRPTHRRRGILRSMMRAHLDDVRERGEPLAALWASESSIYERFGFGRAAYQHRFVIETVHAAFSQPLSGGGGVRLVGFEEAREVLPRIYDEARRSRPGHFARSPKWWEHRRMHDPKADRRGASAYRYALYEDGGTARGYLQYRTLPRWGDHDGLPQSRLYVVELQALDPDARAALWRYALDQDLISRVEASNQPADDGLPWLLADSRRLTRAWRDSLWLRLIDIPRALEGRAYPSEGHVILAVHDEFCPWNEGVYELEVTAQGAACRATTATPELTLEARDLASVYLGGNRLQTLIAAGRVEAAGAAAERADRLFSWAHAPWCPEIF